MFIDDHLRRRPDVELQVVIFRRIRPTANATGEYAFTRWYSACRPQTVRAAIDLTKDFMADMRTSLYIRAHVKLEHFLPAPRS